MNEYRAMAHTDFADELLIEEEQAQGYTHTHKEGRFVRVSHICVHDPHNPLQKPPGDYISISFDSLSDRDQRRELIAAVRETMEELMRQCPCEITRILAVGLGNREIISDALGVQVMGELMVTAHLYAQKETDWLQGTRNVAVLTPGVMGQTGLESSAIIEQVAQGYAPDLIVAVDALATRHLKRINRVIQISNTGIQPGSGIGNHRRPIDEQTLHVPVIALGVATVTSIRAVLEEMFFEKQQPLPDYIPKDFDLTMTPKAMDEELPHLSTILSAALNRAFHPGFEQL